jgi:hypothetical protein
MADPTYLTWNLPNWITVVLMVSLGAVLFGLVASGIGHVTDGGDNS